MQIQESSLPYLGTPVDEMTANEKGFGFEPNVWSGSPISDRIWRNPQPPSTPPSFSGNGFLGGILSQLSSLLQQLMAALGAGGQNFFNTAQASSTGDPHLAFTGNTANGTQQSRFDSMSDHPDLLDSSSVRGGFQIGTEVTTPSRNGVTYNRRGTVTTKYGRTQVSLDNRGNACVTRDGKTSTIASGQTLQLGPNEKVTRNADGSLVVSESAKSGGIITTTLRDNGPGVDVSVDASGVELGGDLLRQS